MISVLNTSRYFISTVNCIGITQDESIFTAPINLFFLRYSHMRGKFTVAQIWHCTDERAIPMIRKTHISNAILYLSECTTSYTCFRSHKGHPMCEFCNARFLDNDELFRHLRRDHFFCHFCDADGSQVYYE